ncbi:TonB-dependent receptor [Pseudomonas silvicola]|uniref:TonB-dependent receptor n=1 Tax=Pseudomonas sp. RIT-To-2 TaxID=3462541 RepID=UPI00227A3D1D|nr:TonB-dependent receptor [Pseudomonas silvicola]
MPRTALRISSSTLALLLANTVPAVVVSSVMAAEERTETAFDVSPGTLSDVVLTLSRQSGQPIAFDPALLQGRNGPAIKGRRSLDEALEQALRGSGLQFGHSQNGLYISASAQASASTSQGSGSTLQAVVVTGNRSQQPRTVASSPSPIDVISQDQLIQTGATSLRDAIKHLVPSFNVQSASSYSQDSIARPATLRGLSPSQTLVLVNGKRRHASSLVNASRESTLANAIDLDLIPLSAIDHIEVLRDGASAQYGSDAIAGVINIILKQNDHGGQTVSKYGRRSAGDGQQLYQSLDQGFALPNDGFFNLALDGRSNKSASTAEGATGAFYGLNGAAPDSRDATVGRHVFGGGLPKIKQINASYNAELPLADDLTLYSFSTVSQRDGWIGANFRRPNATSDGISNSANNVLSIYPNGYTPLYRSRETDFQTTWGVKGVSHEWNWDLSTSYGRDKVEQDQLDSLNASLGDSSPTKFHLYNSIFDQWTNNLDFSRALDLGWHSPLQVAWGLEHRYERYKTQPGDAADSQVGDYQIRGVPAVAGVQAASYVSDSEAADIDRNSYASYIDLGTNPTDKLYVGVAGRLEDYEGDVGRSASGKFSARYALRDNFALRGTLSNGFRAPSLSQIAHQQSSSANYTVNAQTVLVTSTDVAADSAVAKQLGATSLKPEKSTNLSLGFTWQPTDNSNLAVDAYQIKIKDRIVLTGFIKDSGNGVVNSILSSAGYADNTWVRFATNGMDTTTSGLDAVYDYTQDLQRYGSVKWGAALNWNNTSIDKVKNSPAALTGSGNTLLDRTARSYFTKAYPKTKLILSADYTYDPFTVHAAMTRYGSHTDVSSESHYYDVKYGAQWITDLELGWSLTHDLKVAVGAQNLFDVYPAHKGYDLTSNAAGFPSTGSNTPYDAYGAYYYTTLTYNY